MAENKKKSGIHQPRDADRTFGHDVQKSGQPEKLGQSDKKKKQRDTFRHNVQKSEQMQEKNGQGEFSQEQQFFTENENTESQEQQQSDNYHRKDTYHPSQKKGVYRKREHQDRERRKQSDFAHDFQTKETTFTESAEPEFDVVS